MEPSSFYGCNVNRVAIFDDYCFIGCEDGILQVNLNDGSSQLFDYSFIGTVRELYFIDDYILIGSNNGLIKYLWKKYL